MSIHVYPKAVREDSDAAEMASIYRLCKKHDIEVPDNVADFFGYTDPPEDNLAAVNIAPITKWQDGDREYQEFNLSDLPPGTKRIRIVISY